MCFLMPHVQGSRLVTFAWLLVHGSCRKTIQGPNKYHMHEPAMGERGASKGSLICRLPGRRCWWRNPGFTSIIRVTSDSSLASAKLTSQTAVICTMCEWLHSKLERWVIMGLITFDHYSNLLREYLSMAIKKKYLIFGTFGTAFRTLDE